MNVFSFLIIDDDESDRYLLKRLLESGKLETTIFEADDGVAAIDLLQNYEENRAMHGELFPPLIVFLDINMPRMNGFEFLQQFRDLRDQRDAYRSIVFLMVTSSDNERDKEIVSEFDFVKGYIEKFPDTGAELVSNVKPFIV